MNSCSLSKSFKLTSVYSEQTRFEKPLELANISVIAVIGGNPLAVKEAYHFPQAH